MLQKRRPDEARRLLRLRHTDSWVGALVILALVVFFGAIFDAGVIRRFLNPDLTLRLVLPKTGFGGLTAGADIDLLGTHAGNVREVQLNPDGSMYAVAEVSRQSANFIKRNSKATVRRRYGVAGAAFVDISRGTGAGLEWSYAVLPVAVEPNPADTIVATLNQVRAELLPTLDHAQHAMTTIDALVTGLKNGQGSAGRLLVDDSLIHKAEDTVALLKGQIAKLAPILDHLAPLLDQSHAILGNLQSASADVKRTTPQLPAIARNARDATANLPALLTQAQASTEELQKLLAQLRGLWILGGSGTPPPAPRRLPSQEVHP